MKIQTRRVQLVSCGVLAFQLAACTDIRPASRVAPGAEHCAGVCRSFSGDDIRNTGATSVGEALCRLDPSLSIKR